MIFIFGVTKKAVAPCFGATAFFCYFFDLLYGDCENAVARTEGNIEFTRA